MVSSICSPPWRYASSFPPALLHPPSAGPIFLLPSPIRNSKLRLSLSSNAFPESKHYLVNKVSGVQLDKFLDVAERTKPVVVDFYATWCGPCIILAQELERLAVEFGHAVEFIKIDTDEEYELAQKMEVRGLPTVIFVSKDKNKHAIRTEGILPRETYRSIIQEHLL